MVAERQKRQMEAVANKPEVEEVPAEVLVPGDLIFFPNSRNAQAIGNIVDVQDPNPDVTPTRRVASEDGTASWLIPVAMMVKREKKPEVE